MPLKFLKSPKKQKSYFSPATHYAAPIGACECPGVPSVGQLGHTKFFSTTY